MTDKNYSNDTQWLHKLTPEQINPCRLKGTGPSFTGPDITCKEDSINHDVYCGNPLFDSETKYESCSVWPNFQEVLSKVGAQQGNAGHDRYKVEVTCKACDAHLGHVFEDSPEITGLRCINSALLDLQEIA
ncbi:MAG: peptide-methionine (R)-S-oxide reductase [Methylobacter sp.]